MHQRFAHYSKVRRRMLTASSVAGSFIVSPVLAVMAVGECLPSQHSFQCNAAGVGVPIMLAYVYGVVPLSLCRSQGGCGMSASSSGLRLDSDSDDDIWHITGGGAERSEKSRLLHSSTERLGDGTSVVTGYSVASGLSTSAMHNQRLQVQAELCRRRPSVESGRARNGAFIGISMCRHHEYRRTREL